MLEYVKRVTSYSPQMEDGIIYTENKSWSYNNAGTLLAMQRLIRYVEDIFTVRSAPIQLLDISFSLSTKREEDRMSYVRRRHADAASFSTDPANLSNNRIERVAKFLFL